MRNWIVIASNLCLLFVCHFAHAIEVSPGIQVTPLLQTSKSWVGDAIAYPAGVPEVTGQLVELAPGAETGWHRHPVASVGYVLQGELTVQFEDGQTRVVKAGEAAAETMLLRHNGKNTGNIPAKLVVFYLGAAGVKTTIKDSVAH